MKFGDLLKELRQKRAVTQWSLANLLEMDAAYLSKIENNLLASLPSRDTIERIALTLELSSQDSDRLHILAGKIPADVEAALFNDPKLMALVRRRAK